MKSYLNILENIINKGQPKQPVRFDTQGIPIPVSNGTIGTFAEIFRHDMSEGFPLVTTKKMAWKPILVELEGFIKGVTDKSWYQERGCRIWNEWKNPKSNDDNDLGPIYGYQWRKFGVGYGDYTRGKDEGDQLKTIVDRLKTNPYDRRMVCSAWSFNQIPEMALPPCHFVWNVVVYGNKLNLIWHQRSCDHILGVPFNIASYAMLLLLLCKESGLQPGELVGTLNDCHVYNNQLEGANVQLSRQPYPLPTVTIPDDSWSGIFNWTHKDVVLENYQCHPALKFDVTVQSVPPLGVSK